jgi:hypothetical protein
MSSNQLTGVFPFGVLEALRANLTHANLSGNSLVLSSLEVMTLKEMYPPHFQLLLDDDLTVPGGGVEDEGEDGQGV